jgi:ATP-dependent Lon protease
VVLFLSDLSPEHNLAQLEVPSELLILPLFDTVVFPLTVVPMAVAQPRSVQLVDAAIAGQQLVGLLAIAEGRGRPPQPGPDDCYRVGTASLAHRLLRLPDGTLRVAVEGLARVVVEEFVAVEPFLRARVRLLPDEPGRDEATRELAQVVAEQSRRLAALLPNFSAETQAQIGQEDDPSRLAFLVAGALPHLPLAERQAILELPSAVARLERLHALLSRDLAALQSWAVAAPLAGTAERVPARASISEPALRPAASPELLHAALDTLDTLTLPAVVREPLAAYLAGCVATDSPPPLCLFGAPGVGKTFLAHSLADALGRPLALHFADEHIELSPTAQAGRGNAVLVIEGGSHFEPAMLPRELRAYAELLELPGYSLAEKLRIGAEALLPRALLEHGLHEMALDTALLRALVEQYSDDAGLRGLERVIERLCRGIVLAQARGEDLRWAVGVGDLPRLLGEPPRRFDWPDGLVGAATFLSSHEGGTPQLVEAFLTPGAGEQIVVGVRSPRRAEKLVGMALAWLRGAAAEMGFEASALDRARLHVQLPNSDPGAGAAVACALVSALCGWPLRPRSALAAGISLRGQLVPVDRLAARLLAAERVGAEQVLLPLAQRAEAERVGASLGEHPRLIFVEHLPQLVGLALQAPAHLHGGGRPDG